MPSKNRSRVFDNTNVGKKVERSTEELRKAAIVALDAVAGRTPNVNVEECKDRIQALIQEANKKQNKSFLDYTSKWRERNAEQKKG